MLKQTVNINGVQLKVGDKIIITSDTIGSKSLGLISKNEILTITSFSEDGKILYHNNSLAISVNSDIYKKL